MCSARRGAQQLQEIKRGALRGQQRSCRAGNGEQDLIRGGGGPFGQVPLHGNLAIDCREARVHIGYAANNGRLAGDDGGTAGPIDGNQGGREVARAHIFGQGASDLLRKVGRRRKRCRQSGSPCDGPIMHISMGMESRKLMREA